MLADSTTRCGAREILKGFTIFSQRGEFKGLFPFTYLRYTNTERHRTKTAAKTPQTMPATFGFLALIESVLTEVVPDGIEDDEVAEESASLVEF